MSGAFSPVVPKEGRSYYAEARADIVAALPRPLGSVLDVGCGSGGAGPGLRAAGATRLTGIELEPSEAVKAEQIYDTVVTAPVETALDQLEGPFNTLLLLDILEHLVDPEDVLTRLRELAAPGAVLQISIPNARHFSLVRDLVFRGTFGYADWGHRDATHLRWFTRKDMGRLIENSGYELERSWQPRLGKSRILHRLTFGRSTEFIVGQLYFRARRA